MGWNGGCLCRVRSKMWVGAEGAVVKYLRKGLAVFKIVKNFRVRKTVYHKELNLSTKVLPESE